MQLGSLQIFTGTSDGRSRPTYPLGTKEQQSTFIRRAGRGRGVLGSLLHGRINKLRSDNVIVADISLVNPKALGKSLTVVVNVELDRERLDLINEFKRAMRAERK